MKLKIAGRQTKLMPPCWMLIKHKHFCREASGSNRGPRFLGLLFPLHCTNKKSRVDECWTVKEPPVVDIWGLAVRPIIRLYRLLDSGSAVWEWAIMGDGYVVCSEFAQLQSGGCKCQYCLAIPTRGYYSTGI